jgi:hypothetical protein
MCEIGTILAIGSTVLGAAGAIQQGNAAAAAGKYNAQVADMNATLSERRARDALERGEREEQRKRSEVAALKGRQIAASASNGVDLSFGSPLDMIVDTAVLGELDALTIRKNTANEAYDHRVQAVNGRAEARLSKMNASAAQTGGYLNAAGTLLGGAGTAYKNYKQPTIGAIA